MPISHAILLGIVQGVTEVLPISSSAHLALIPWFFKWQYQGVSFDVALHLGTALAFVVFFWNDWVAMLRSGRKLLWYIAIGTIPAALAGVVLEKKAETIFRSPLVMATMLAVFAAILWWADHYGKKMKSMGQLNGMTTFLIGCAQALALIPGVSRSGITITAGLLGGLSRQAAARFSFLLATPIVIAAGVLKLPKLRGQDFDTAFFAGLLFSAASGYVGIRFLLRFVQRSSFTAFAVYRIAFALIILYNYWYAVS